VGKQQESNLHGNHRDVFVTKQTTLIQSNTTQIYFNSLVFSYMCATCFGLYLGHSQRPLRFVLHLSLNGFRIDMPEYGLSVGRNMWGICKCN
jgi:hypothetical protein